ncbi:hypothetical protein G5B38_14875 [Pseudohalocynthiibacter aestuariivivens]|nr:hypothetical protein [Pseudohalocynthiibacter aestuariivivens]QIE46703.1 hypothetical protein G5B38_14875 [Pseudohalocynthiibacter aestuariivivens]
MSDVIRILIAPLVWLACFSAIYGLHGLSCSAAFEPDLPVGAAVWQLLMILAGGVAVTVQVCLLFALRHRAFASGSGFVNRVSAILVWTSLAATLWTLFPVLLSSGCA